MFAKGKKVVTTQQINEDVLHGDNGIVLGIRKNKETSGIRFTPFDVKVKFNTHHKPYYVDPTSLKLN